MTVWRRILFTLSACCLGACTLAMPDGPPPGATSRAPTGQAPADVLTPNALRTPSPEPFATPTPDDTCRVVNDALLAVRVSTDITAAEVTILDVNATSAVVGRTGQNTWWQVRTPDNRMGWLDASAVEIYGDCLDVPILAAPTLTVAATATPSVPTANILVNLNVRRGPSIRFNPPIGRFTEGERAEIIAVNTSRDWYKVVYQGSQGWVSASPDFVRATGPLNTLPVDPGPPTPTATNTPIPATPTATLDPNTNYLRDPSFEGVYTGRGFADLNAPVDWEITYTEEPRAFFWQNNRPVAFPHITPPEVRSGERSVNINRNYATFTAVLYQRVSVPTNITVRASAHAWLHTCEPAPSVCSSNDASNARVRVGIDPFGGEDPFAERVVWSDFARPHDRWEDVGVRAGAAGSTVTVFLYATQDTPTGLNQVYWDDAGVFVGG
ncbi:MAG: SH3 domain-containing protein [Chloroflexota bacterium]